MAAPTANITSVQTEDADPFVAPHRLSQETSHRTLLVVATISGLLGSPMGYYQFYQGVGTGRLGRTKKLKSFGVMCGVGCRCGENNSVSGGVSMPMVTDGNGTGSRGVSFGLVTTAMGMSAQGNYTIGVDAANEDGWST